MPNLSLNFAINLEQSVKPDRKHAIIGFRIMKESSVAIYMLFLMSGGMLVPSVWGWIFLHEEPKPMHIIGLVVILVSIIINNVGKE